MNKPIPFYCVLFFMISCISVLLCQCTASKKTPSTVLPSVIPVAENENEHEQILFLTFKLFKDSTKTAGESIQLLTKKSAKGVLKQSLKSAETIYPGYLVCSFQDQNKNVLSAMVVEDPLTTSVEYLDDAGSLKRTFIEKREADLFLRIQNSKPLFILSISKVSVTGIPIFLGEFLLKDL